MHDVVVTSQLLTVHFFVPRLNFFVLCCAVCMCCVLARLCVSNPKGPNRKILLDMLCNVGVRRCLPPSQQPGIGNASTSAAPSASTHIILMEDFYLESLTIEHSLVVI